MLGLKVVAWCVCVCVCVSSMEGKIGPDLYIYFLLENSYIYLLFVQKLLSAEWDLAVPSVIGSSRCKKYLY